MDIETSTPKPEEPSTPPRLSWVWDLMLICILAVGIYFRLGGLNWDQNYHLHPDERFLTMVETSLQPVKSLGDYFNTDVSTLNPHNQGYGFYVYGTLPIFVVRYLAEALQQTGYDQVHLVGRAVSAFMDLLTVLLVYLIAMRLYRRPRLALLAAAFSALAVMQIQLSHYFTVDTFTNFCTFLAFYFAVRLFTNGDHFKAQMTTDAGDMEFEDHLYELRHHWRTSIPYVLFGIALGMAMASKVSVVFIAAILPLAAWIRFAQLTPEEKQSQVWLILRNLILAGLVSFLVFRICQPYAFQGPGFFGVGINEKWLNNLKELSAQSAGDVDFPPALQWARRPLWFAWENQVKWGLGLPLGLLAWAGFLWMGWRMLRGEWKQHGLVWGWTAFFFAWQSTVFNPTMRYLLPIYPTLAIIAAWTVFALWDKGRQVENRARVWRTAAVAVGVVALVGAAVWAYAFTAIYRRPMTRVAASQWIYQNVPGPINLRVQTAEGSYTQPQPFQAGKVVQPDRPLTMSFKPAVPGTLIEVALPHVLGTTGQPNGMTTYTLAIDTAPDFTNPLVQITQPAQPQNEANDPRGGEVKLALEQPVMLNPDQTYYLRVGVADVGAAVNLTGSMSLGMIMPGGTVHQMLPEIVDAIRPDDPYILTFAASRSGTLSQIDLAHVLDWGASPESKTLRLSLLQTEASDDILASAEVQSAFIPRADGRGDSYSFVLDRPVQLKAGSIYTLKLELTQGEGTLGVYGSRHALETGWDDPLPLSMDGLNPFDLYSGIYRSDLNFEMYWDDNADKRARFESILDQADYLYITSSRQWGSIVRVPERYPLSTAYYRALIGCPADKEITWCYSVARPGMFQGTLGFDLVHVEQSDPNIGPLRFNTQFAEEAFTVYDHPKVLIFQKRSDYSSRNMRTFMNSVDISRAVHLTPRKAGQYRGAPVLPADRLAGQQAGGTWSELYDTNALYNRYPAVGAVLWYVVLTLLGWAFYPLVRVALGGLADRGFPVVRLAAMLVLSYVVWLAGSAGIPFARWTISLVAAALLALNGWLAWRQRHDLKRELRERGRYYVMVEVLILALFVFDLLIRLGNPDLWHPYKGGEKPMDFSYFNAVLKSTTFPPYDPWFQGGYINYYYYGFVLVGVLVKWLGIQPSIAYNLILPTLFSLLGAGAFCMGWNLLSPAARKAAPPVVETDALPEADTTVVGVEPLPVEADAAGAEDMLTDEAAEEDAGGDESRAPLYAGLASTLGLLILGNLGTVRMIWHGLMRLVAPGGVIDPSSLFERIQWTVAGLASFIGGNALPYAPGDWYWIPSRAIPGEPITEFPFFTFLYADLHAHMLALPVTVLVLVWAISIVRGRWNWRDTDGIPAWGRLTASLLLGGLAVGALRPINTWDFPTYLVLAGLALIYTALRYAGDVMVVRGRRIPPVVWAVGAAALLVVLAFVTFKPFAQWYIQGYNQVDLFEGDRTPVWSYLTHWGLFLFVIVSWMVWESIDWMAHTPLYLLNKLHPYRQWIVGAAVSVLLVMAVLLIYGVSIAWLALLIAVWVVVLMLRPGQSDMRRAVLFLVLSGIGLTLVVELVVLVGDIGRMNTVFKFYLQAWTMLSLSAAAGLFWLMRGLRRWNSGWQTVWSVFFALLVGGAALFPLMGGVDKIKDRMDSRAPHSLDGLAYMSSATYADFGVTMDLGEDYRAIRWMQENVQGSPVIVEANTVEYHWGSRFTINTGLPGVVGWNWHQRQQRGSQTEEVTARVAAVGVFYQTTDYQETVEFLQRYGVRYVVVGQLERAQYLGDGLAKFDALRDKLWREVYRDGSTVIYEVIS